MFNIIHNLKEGYVDYFSSSYKGNFLVWKRARSWVYFVSGLQILLLALILGGTFIGMEPLIYVTMLAAAIPVMLILFGTLFILKKGHYDYATNIGIILTMSILIAIAVPRAINNPEHLFQTSPFFWIATFIASMEFTNNKVVRFSLLTYILAALFFRLFFVTPARVPPELMASAQTGFLYTIISLLICGWMGNLIIRSFEEAIWKSERESLELKKKDESNQKMITTIKDTFKSLNTVSMDINSIVEDLSQNSQSQAAVMEELSSSAETLTSNAINITDSVKNQNQNLEELQAKMIELSKALDTIEHQAKGFSQQFEEFNQDIDTTENDLQDMDTKINNMSEGQGEMNKIVEIIEEFFDKINLFALNASIEAARAGDAGKGFGVIAEEIRQMADNSKNKLLEISRVITQNVDGMQGVATQSKKTLSSVQELIKKVVELKPEAGKIIQGILSQRTIKDEINHKTQEVKVQADNIQNITKKQSSTMQEESRMLEENSQTTQSNAERATNLGEKADELIKLADQLKTLLGHEDEENPKEGVNQSEEKKEDMNKKTEPSFNS